MWRENVILFVMLVSASCDNGNGDSEEPRKPRFFTFKPDDEDVKLELTLTIPFINIPAKKAYNSVFGILSGDGPPININPATIAVGGAIVIGSTLLLPLVFKSLSHEYVGRRYSRLLDVPQFSADAFLEMVSQALANRNSFHGCALRLACWSGHRSQPDHLRVWHQITGNKLVSTIINATAIEDALLWGRKGRDCHSYNPCPLTGEYIPLILENLADFTNSVRSNG